MADDVESTVKALQGLSPADQAAMMPETFANPLVKKKIDDLAGVMAIPGNVMASGNGGMLPTEDLIKPALEMTGQFGMMGVPMAKPGTAGIFGGDLARTADLRMLDKAQTMNERGFNNAGIRKATGWHQDPAGDWQFEIGDEKSRMLYPEGKGPAGAMFQHNEAYKAYPELKDIKLQSTIDPTIPPGMGGGGWNPRTADINLKSPNAADARLGMLHELNHAVQHMQGFSPGATKDLYQLLFDRNPEVAHAIPGETLTPYELYRRTTGEVASRNVEARADFRPLQRQQVPPWLTQDYLPGQQLRLPPFDPREILPQSMLPLDLQSHPIVNALKNK